MAGSSLMSLPNWQKSNLASGCCREFEGYMPPRCAHNAVCVNEELIVWGGYNDENGTKYCTGKVIWLFNIEHDVWYCISTSGHRPDPRTGAVSALIWPNWYIIGGNSYLGDNCETHRLNLLTLVWERFNFHPTPPYLSRDKSSAWIWKERIYVFGGYGQFTFPELWKNEEDNFVYEEHYGWNDQLLYLDCELNEWIRPDCVGDKPSARAAHTSTRVGTAVYVFGGRHRTQRLNDLYRLQLETHEWSGRLECFGELPCGRSWHTMTKCGEMDLLLYGGYSTSRVTLDDVWVLKTDTLSWSQLTKHTGLPRLWHTACMNSLGDVLIFGGCPSDIIDDKIKMETSQKVVMLRRNPFTLTRLCLHAAFKHRDFTSSQWDQLPGVFQEWLMTKAHKQQTIRPTMDLDSHVLWAFGPPLSNLAIS